MSQPKHHKDGKVSTHTVVLSAPTSAPDPDPDPDPVPVPAPDLAPAPVPSHES